MRNMWDDLDALRAFAFWLKWLSLGCVALGAVIFVAAQHWVEGRIDGLTEIRESESQRKLEEGSARVRE